MISFDNYIKIFSKITVVKGIYRRYFRQDLKKIEDEAFNELISLQKISIEQQSETQNMRLIGLLQYANESCPYYQEIFSTHNISVKTLEDFKQIPYLDKRIIKQHLDKIISQKIKSTELRISNTGGSTGEPLEFYTDLYSSAVDNAHHKFLYHLMGFKKGDIIVSSGGIKLSPKLLQKNIYWYKYPKGTVWGHWGFSALYLSKKNIKFYIDKIIELKPSIFRGYPSFFNELSLYILENKIRFNFDIKGLNLTAEYCSNEQRNNIENAFNSKVYFEYGQSEKTVYCFSDGSSYFYKSSPIYGYIEVLNDKGEGVLLGEEGEVIVTSLCNFAVPFIRYRTGDRAILKSKFGGIIEFETISGRTQDFIMDNKNQKIFLTALIFGQHFKAFKNILQWQIVQERIGFIEINIVKNTLYSENDEKEIITKIKTIADVDMIVNYVEDVNRTKSGKRPFVIQKLNDSIYNY
jgi:phenylacetate-CoA ligase